MQILNNFEILLNIAPIRILYLFIKSFVNPFVDIAVSFSDSSFNSFLPSTYFVLFEVTLLFKCFSFLSKSVFFAKLEISFLLAKFAYANFTLKYSAVNLLNYWVVIYYGNHNQ